MELIKKIGLTALIILFLISIFKDLTVGTIVRETETANSDEIDNSKEEENSKEKDTSIEQSAEPENNPEETNRYKVISKTVETGDTVLSIVESINPNQQSVMVNQIILDFEELNPGIDPHLIEPNKSYFFPSYKNLQ